MKVLLFCLLLGGLACAVQAPRDVDQAFAEIRRGNLAASEELLKLGPKAAPGISRYVSDRDEAVRREAVEILAGIGGTEPCRYIVPALADSSADLRERAARALYARCPAEAWRSGEAAGALRKSVAEGNGAAAAYLMLGHFPDPATEEVLRAALEDPSPVKLERWQAPVPASFPALVALARLERGGAEERLVPAVRQAGLNELVFLLHVLDEIQSRPALRALSSALGDSREISGGVPAGATPRRRVQDLAVDTFVRRLKLEPGFVLQPAGRYTPDQISGLRGMVEKALASQ